MYKIDKDVPPPSPSRTRVYPFREMEVGDSFAFDPADKVRVASAVSTYSKMTGRRFAVRKEGRCWRVS